LDEFAEYGFDLTSIQQVIRKAGIPRGSFYQYFDDKMDLFTEILRITRERKLSYLAPAIENWRSLDFFEFLQLVTRLGMKFGWENPKTVKIAQNILSNKILDIQKLQEVMLDHSEENPEIGTFEFYRLVIKNAMDKGSLRSNISPDTAALFTKSMMESLSHTAINRKFEDPTDKEMDDLCSEFFSILKDGLAEKE